MDEIAPPSPLARAARALIAFLEDWPNGAVDEAGLGAFARAYCDLTHILAHIEANARVMREDAVLTEIRSFVVSEGFRRRACERIRSITPTTVSGITMRNAWLGWLDHGLAEEDIEAQRVERRLADDLTAQLEEARSDEGDLLRRLGVACAPGGHGAAYFAVAGRMVDAALRRKLHQAWTKTRTRRVEDLAAALQCLVRARFRHAREAGFDTPLARSQVGGTLAPDALRDFLQAALAEAVAGLRDLSDLASGRLGGRVGLSIDVPRLLITAETSGPRLLLPAEGCLSFIAQIAQRALGVHIEAAGPGFSGARGATLIVQRERSKVGTIHVGTTRQSPGAGTATNGPAAWILCRLAASGGDVVTLDGARLMFHELGHAIAHILVEERSPGTSGLDDLPVERFELLSTWFETWVHHSSLEEWLGLSDEARISFARARRVKAIEFSQSQPTRVVCALVDLAAHTDSSADVLALLRAVRGAHPEIEAVVEREVLGDFVHPLLMSHPGCSFVYPLASAFACARVLPRLDDPLDALGPDLDLTTLARSGRDSFPLPDPRAPRLFFDRVGGPLAGSSRGTAA